MPTTNPVVSGLSAYVQQNKDVLIKNFALAGTDTRSRISVQTGIKNKAHLHYFQVAPTLQDGSACGFSAAGDATISQREIEVAAIKVNLDWCNQLLRGKYAEYLIRINAVENSENMAFEEYMTEALTNELNKKIEKLMWQGDKSSASTDLKWIDGYLEQMSDESASLAASVSIASGKSAYEGILAVYMAMPEETLARGGMIFVSPAIFRAFVQDLVAANYYHFNPNDGNFNEIIFPGSDVKVVKTPGLAGSLKIVGTFAENLVYGTDMEGDFEDLKIWFSDDDDVWKVKVLWATGVAYHFPDQIVVGTFAAAPVALNPIVISNAAIAENTAGE
jgi:hypothetical protein